MDTQDPARLSLVQAAADEARFFVYAYNATTLVTTAGLVLGIFFVVTAVALYLYYLVQEEKLKKKNWEYKGGNYRQDKSGGVYLGVVELLEQAWALYNIEGQDCRRSLVCEAHLPTASHVNFPVSETLKHLLGSQYLQSPHFHLLPESRDSPQQNTQVINTGHLYPDSQVTEDMLGEVDKGQAAVVRDLQLAAQYGRTVKNCLAYERYCPGQGLANISQN
ncbi:uncharacterized protein [Cherax quadricarinatus]|uniref:uncharacterized protein n=1 Tax=Cherax quadricarinatus TaxID=27406 RepID=UPI00387E7A00